MFYKERPQDMSKIICVDFDDTLSFTKTRNWESADVNKELIKRLNELQKNGWYILVLTARGSISCDSRKEADKKYRKNIEQFLNFHGLIYNELSFNKPLAAYYIDDKGILPEEFLNIDITPIKRGKSGAIVEKHGNEIYKTHTDSREASKWYIKAESAGLSIPEIKSLVGNTLRMEYIKHDDILNFHAIGNELNCIASTPSLGSDFITYIDRIDSHLKINVESGHLLNDERMLLLENMHRITPFMNMHKSFMHGDFSIENMIFNKTKGLVLIDPIYIKDLYSSVYLDIAKLSHSGRKHNNSGLQSYCRYVMKRYTDDLDKSLLNKVLKILETTQWVRILKYHTNDPNFKKYLNITKDLINAKL